MKNVSGFLIIILILIACQRTRPVFSEDVIKEYARGDFEIPSRYSYLYIFVITNNNRIGQTNIDQLHGIYKKNYESEYATFSAFLSSALNQEITIPENQIKKWGSFVFKVDSQIKINYEKHGVRFLINKYCIIQANELSIEKAQLSPEKLFSLFYYLFINHYEITEDDYIGKYYARKSKLK